MPQLHEIVAVTTGKKGDVEKAMTEVYHLLQKGDLFDGMTRRYEPLNADDSEKLAGETKLRQQSVKDLVALVRDRLATLFDATVTLDRGNQEALADVVLGGVTLAAAVPVTTLLFLEKQFANVKAFVEKIPTPDPAEQWAYDGTTGVLTTLPTQSYRTKKVKTPVVLIQPTPEHPGQAQLVDEDKVVGTWTTVKTSSKMPAVTKAEMLARVERLHDAVKAARERANSIEVAPSRIAADLLAYVFDAPK